MYNKVSLPKASGSAAAPVPKDPNVILVDLKDVKQDPITGEWTGYPARDGGGVKITGNILLNAAAKAVALYMTPTTISRNDTSEGDPDAVAFTQNFTGEHPGDELEFAEFIQNNINTDWLIISTECSESKGTRLQGTPCNPMKLTFEGQDDKDAKKGKLTFKQDQRSKFKSAHYYGALPARYDIAAPVESSESGA